MKRRISNEKVRARTYIKNDLHSAVTNILNESNNVQKIISQLAQIMSGSVFNSGNDLIDTAKQTLSSLSQSLQYLHKAEQTASQLDVTEEVSDD